MDEKKEFVEPVLWKHQETALKRACTLKEFGLLFEQGTGKTLTTIIRMRHIYINKRAVVRTLIIVPIIVLDNWKRELRQFSKIPTGLVHILHGRIAKRIAALKNLEGIVITNYEAIAASDKFYNALDQWGAEVIVLDESQRIKTHNSKRTKRIVKLGAGAEYRMILTGTPILNSPLDIFSQWLFLDQGATFGKNVYQFRAKYFYDANSGMPKQNYFPDWKFRQDKEAELSALMALKSMRVEKKDCLDLPPLVRQSVEVELSKEQKSVYKSMAAEYVAWFRDAQSNKESVIVADLAIVKSLRLAQIISGHVPDDEKKVHYFKNTPRRAALKELLSDIATHSKVIVWAVFKADYAVIREVCEELEINYVEAHGAISNKRKIESVDEFNKGDAQVIIGHPGSLGVGINLVAAKYSIYYSRTWNLEHDLQSEARNYRGGSEIHDKITRIDIIAKDTIDVDMVDALRKKLKSADAVLKALENQIGG